MSQTEDTGKVITYFLRLFVAGNEPNSKCARENLGIICDEHFRGSFQIEEIDVLKDFEAALKDRIFVTPAVIRVVPVPRVVIFGQLSDKQRVLSALLGDDHGT